MYACSNYDFISITELGADLKEWADCRQKWESILPLIELELERSSVEEMWAMTMRDEEWREGLQERIMSPKRRAYNVQE